MPHGGNAIWGGSRVRLTQMHSNIRPGAEGVNLGKRQDGEILVRLDDGREARLPLNLLERIDTEEYVPDAITWKAHPKGRVWHPHMADTVKQQEYRGEYCYQLRGFSGKWYVARVHDYNQTVERTKFYPNQRLAQQAFDHIVNGE
ncbi:hypothetical protein [Actinomadura sp. WMMB 499]|uniref:hypothetical protein n=1 Tax=Actinomadura sp. WMMB 499 TaxID=1219491 RepID=UPI001244A48B|nr:hypothetical protein [Actinomadura sp. WMMB 499]QFG25438.1 hypothetical protein F7P10_34040 [Actinomadura sp. WMMB 499]